MDDGKEVVNVRREQRPYLRTRRGRTATCFTISDLSCFAEDCCYYRARPPVLLPRSAPSVTFSALRIRWTDAALMPAAAASARIVHRLAGGGIASSAPNRWRAPSVTVTFRPRPGASASSAAGPPPSNRRLQSATLRVLTPTCAATSRIERPSATSSTIRVRLTTRCGVLPARIQAVRMRRSASVRSSRLDFTAEENGLAASVRAPFTSTGAGQANGGGASHLTNERDTHGLSYLFSKHLRCPAATVGVIRGRKSPAPGSFSCEIAD